MPATARGRRHLRGPRGVTHTKAPCASKLPERQPGRRAPHPVPRTAAPTLTLHKEAIPVPWLKDGAPLGLPQPAPPEAGTRARDVHATPSKFALSPRCALNPPCLQEETCTPNSGSPQNPSRRLETPGTQAHSPLVQSTTCLGLHLVTGSMVNSFVPSWARVPQGKGCCCVRCPSPEGATRGRPCASERRVKAAWLRSVGHAARLSRGSAALCRQTRQPCGYSPSCHDPATAPSPPPAAARSPTPLLLLGDRGCGDAGLHPRRPAPGWARDAPGPARKLLCSCGLDPPVLRPRAPLRLRLLLLAACFLGVPAQRAASPSVPACRSHLLRLPLCRAGEGSRAKPERSGYKVSAPVAAPGIKEGAGPRTGETRGRGWVPPKQATPVTFPP